MLNKFMGQDFLANKTKKKLQLKEEESSYGNLDYEDQIAKKQRMVQNQIQEAQKKLDALDEQDKEQEFESRANCYLKSRQPKVNKKFKFDCTQLSPAVRLMVGSCNLPINKKGMSISSYQASDFLSQDLSALYSKVEALKIQEQDIKI